MENGKDNMTNPKLVCPGCNHEFIPSLLIEIYGYCCLNERCQVGNTLPNKVWYLNGVCHREDGPAFEYANGTKSWYLNGVPHREAGPAIEHPNGTKEWWLNGRRHRKDGPAIEYADGSKDWFLNGKRHTRVVQID